MPNWAPAGCRISLRCASASNPSAATIPEVVVALTPLHVYDELSAVGGVA